MNVLFKKLSSCIGVSLLAFLSLCSTVTVQAQSSRIELHTMWSAILGAQKDFNVFLPQDYDSSTDSYPVVYLFRGDASEWVNPTQDASRKGNIKTVADTLFASGAIGKMILVMPGLSQPATDLDLQYTVAELIPYVDQHFRTLPTRWQRGIDGFSYGGLSTIRLLLTYPEYFSSVGSYDGSLFAIDPNSYRFTDPAYLSKIRPVQILIHSAVVLPNNSLVNQEFVDTLAAYGIQNAFSTIALSSTAAHDWYNADLHMSFTLPLHWTRFLHARANVQVRMTEPGLTEKLAGSVQVKWSAGNTPPAYVTVLSCSRDTGATWSALWKSSQRDSTFLWNTLTVPDGTLYKLRVEVVGDTSYGVFETPDCFTIDNPGNATPDVLAFSPKAHTVVSGDSPVSWLAQDADGDSLSISVDLTPDEGLSWQSFAVNIPNVSPFVLNTKLAPNTDHARLRIRCWDGTVSAEKMTPVFSIQNARTILAGSNVHHVEGGGDGVVSIAVVDAAALKAHTYRMTIDDTSSNIKRYDILDVNTNERLVQDGSGIGMQTEGPLFDGVRLVVADLNAPTVNEDSVRWIVGTSDLAARVITPLLVSGRGVQYPADYEIRIAGHFVDTSSSELFSTPTPMYFLVWNVTENHQVNVIFNDVDNNHQVGPGDDFIILEKSKQGTPIITWDVVFDATTSYRPPNAGDVLKIRVMKPLTNKDVFEFVTTPTGVAGLRGIPTSFYLAHNYPNPFNPATTIRFGISGRSRVRLSVYNLLGQQIAELANEILNTGEYERVWRAGAASGLYFCRLDASSLDNPNKHFVDVKKMILLK